MGRAIDMLIRSLVALNLLLLLLFAFASVSSTPPEAAKPPSCAACLSTSRALDRALQKEMNKNLQQQQQPHSSSRRGRSLPSFTTEPAVAAALALPCKEVSLFLFPYPFLLEKHRE
jgi:hypothetical protein